MPQSEVAPRSSRPFLRLLTGSFGPIAVVGVVLLVFGLVDRQRSLADGRPARFLTVENMRLLGEETVMVAIAALGMTVIIAAGGIDLSAGTSVALSAMVAAWMIRAGHAVAPSLLAAVAVACFVGFINGTLISLLRVVPFIITLGMMTIVQGVTKLISDTDVEARVPQWLSAFVHRGDAQWLIEPVLPNFAYGVWLLAGLAVALAAVLRYSVFGRYVFAIGSNESTARLCGVNVTWTKIGIYAFAGLFVGLAGIMKLALNEGASPTGGAGLELKVIAAVVIGGGSLAGGRGSVLGTIAGAALMAIIENACNFLGIANSITDIVIGPIIIAAVALDQIRQRRLSG